jgi:hypothetical protein
MSGLFVPIYKKDARWWWWWWRRRQKKTKNLKQKCLRTNCTYVYTANADRDCDLLYYMTDSPSRQGGRPTTNKTSTVLTTTKIWSSFPQGPNARANWPTITCKVTLTLTLTAIITEGYHRLRTQFYTIFFSQGWLHMQMKLLGITWVNFNGTDELLIRYSVFVRY